MITKIMSKIYVAYIEIVALTSKVTIDKEFDSERIKNSIVSSWHGDSFAMNFLLREFSNEKNVLYGVTNSSWRGQFIAEMMHTYGGKSVRMPSGIKMKGYLTKLKEVSKIENSSIYITLDGPDGPVREPKKIGFMLSNESGKKLLLVDVTYSRKVILRRWDKYAIPLPFGKIYFTAHDIGVVSKENLKEFKDFKNITKELYSYA